MIKHLYIQNFILIDELKLEFSRGFNVITGETGAGKSIILNAIDIALGAKASLDTIKTGEQRALIELTLVLDSVPKMLADNGIELLDGEITISKEILPTTTRSRINGIMVTQELIKAFKELFLDLHSQHQTYTYIQPKYHIVLLDNFGEQAHTRLLEHYKNIYKDYLQTRDKLAEATSAANVTENQIDFLKFQIDEIESAQIEDFEEDNRLNAEVEVLLNAEKLKELAYSSYYALYEDDKNVTSVISSICANVKKAASLDDSLSETLESLINAVETIKDSAMELRNYTERLNSDPQKLDETQQRIDLLDKLKRKYGRTLDDVDNELSKFKDELSGIEFSTQNMESLTHKLKELESELDIIAGELSASRKSIAKQLCPLIQAELENLEMPKVRFDIDIRASNLKESGKDDIEFLISTNISEPPKPLSKIASGGEVSRVMLAIKKIFAQTDKVNTIIFDEIDTGISGRAAQSVADAIEALAALHQVIAITHQPVIAAKAHKHLYVTKSQDGTTKVKVHTLNPENQIKAIAMLASGEITEESVNFAKKLLGMTT